MKDWSLLWFDDSTSRDLAEKIQQAARRYRRKFGREPNTCYIHRSLIPPTLAGIQVTTSPTVLRHHFMVCRRDE